ncbi:hypothetical protein D3C77_711170 [compost metagenome]
MPSGISPISCSANFTGIGLDSMNRALCSGISLSLMARAASASPRMAAAQRSAMARGATLAVTEMLPLPPISISSTAVASSPE